MMLDWGTVREQFEAWHKEFTASFLRAPTATEVQQVIQQYVEAQLCQQNAA